MYAVFCTIRRQVRRNLWLLLVAGGLFLYPLQWAWQVQGAAAGLGGRDALAAMSAMAAQLVSPDYLYSKLSIAVGVFCLIMGLAWTGMRAVMGVLPGWATGAYAKPQHYKAVGLAEPVRGFKYTFLTLTPLQRICLFLATLALLVLAAGLGVWAAFTIQ